MGKKQLLSLLVLSLLVLAGIVFASFTPTATTGTVKTSSFNQTINLTITSGDTTANITQVNISLPSQLLFVSGTNSTNATNWNFSYSNDSSSLNWTTSSLSMIGNGSSAWFAFRVNTSFVFNAVNLTVTTVNNTGTSESKNVTITIEPYSLSTNRTFGAIPNILYLNWTNSYRSQNITIIGNQSSTQNITLEILNSTAFIANYSQTNTETACSSSNFTLLVQNASGLGTIIGTINGSSSSYNNTNTTYVLLNTFQCSPGRYRINNLVIRNISNSTFENLSISVVLDVPISSNSSNYPLNVTSGIGSFAGAMSANASTYHSYFFNATSMNYTASPTNITSVSINMTGWSSYQDIDMFLFDNSGNLKAKAINKTGTGEWLTYNYLPSSSSQMWEVRIFGNSTNSTIPYTSQIVFGTLDVINSSNTSQQISLINFGSSMSFPNISIFNMTLKNGGSINMTNVSESKELYYVQRFGGTGNQNISFLVPNSSTASKVKVSLNWTGASNYSFSVYKPDGNLIMSSMNKFVNANVTNAVQEEFDETTNIGSANGYWRIEIKNNTNTIDRYNVTTYVHVNASRWISSNFTNATTGIFISGMDFPNSTYPLQVNLSVQNDTLDGQYEGHIQYQSSSGATIRIPLQATTKTGMLIINQSMGGSIAQIDENIGATLTRVLNVTYNNTGTNPLSINTTNSSGMLNLSASNKSFSFDYTSPSVISPGANGMINITFNINSTNTSNVQGVYEGYITFITNDSRPHSNFTLTLRVNLTNILLVGFSSITPSITPNTSAQNITLGLTVTYLNGTGLDSPNSMSAINDTANSSSNFTSAWLVSSNYSSYRVPATGTFNIINGTNPICFGCSAGSTGVYSINITTPADSIGGTYEVRVAANYSRTDNKTFSGLGISGAQGRYLIINNTGLLMSTNYTGCSFGSTCSPSITLSPGNSTTIHANVTNYGPLTSAGTTVNNITFSESCAGYSVSSASYSGCPSTSFAPAGNSSNCTASWTITAASDSAGASACAGNIIGSGYWFDTRGINLTVTVSNTSSSSSSSSSSGGTTTPTTTTYNLEFSKAETMVMVQQSSSNSTEVGVKNTGTASQNVTFRLEGINSTWYTLNATSANIAASGTTGFKITFIVGNVSVADYSGIYNATSPNKAVTKNFTLRVSPAPAEQLKINDTLALYKVEMVKLEVDINESKERKMNVTLAEEKLKELKSKMDQAENYIKQGDYFNANQLLPTIKSLIDSTKDELSKAKAIVSEKNKKRVWIFIGIGAGMVVAGVLAYLFWPTKGYHPEKKAFFFGRESLWDKIKMKLSRSRKR